MKSKKNIVVTGANGQLGSYLVKRLRDLSFYKSSCIGKVFGIDKDELDIRDADGVSAFFSKNAIDKHVDINYVIHCAAATDTTAIEKDPYSYYETNVLGTRNLAESCAHNKIKFIFISTDYVLSELSKPVKMNLQEFPTNQYGLQKLLAEMYVKQAYAVFPENCLILRSSWMFGNSSNSFVEKFLRNAFASFAKTLHSNDEKSKVEVKVADDAYGRPTPVWLVFQTIMNAINDGRCYGTYDVQYACKQINRWTWAKMIWDELLSLLSHAIESDERFKNAFWKDILSKMIDDVAIVPTCSADLNVPLHHPGKICDMFQAFAVPDDENAYLNDIKTYLAEKSTFFLSMMEEIIKKDDAK